MKKKILLLLMLALSIVTLNFVSALVLLDAPFNVSFGNYTSTISINCSSSLNTTDADGAAGVGDYNASIYYNSSGGAAGATGSEGTLLVTIVNDTASQGRFNTSSESITGLSDDLRIYNFSCKGDNGTDTDWSSTEFLSENITIANDVHINITQFLVFNDSLDAMNNYGNFSGNMSFNATVNISIGGGNISADGFGYLDSVYFNLSLSGVKEMFWQAIDDTANSIPYNETLDTFNGSFSDGYQTWTLGVYANSSIGSIINFTEVYTITIDNNAPGVSLSKDAAGSGSDTIKLTISPGETGTGTSGDCTTNFGTVTLFSVTYSSLVCGTSHSFTVSCQDFMGFTGSKTESFSTDDCPGAPLGGAGAAIRALPPVTYTVSESQLEEGYTKAIAKAEQIKMTINNEKHTIEATEITADKVTIKITSEPIISALSIGETKNFDVTGDGLNDLSVTLNSVKASKADLTVKSISKEEAEAAKKPEVTAEKKSLLWLWILVIVAAIVIAYFLYKKARR